MKKKEKRKLVLKKSTLSNLESIEKIDLIKIRGATTSTCGGFTGMQTDYTCQNSCEC
jgi:hypothetical protein